MSCRPLTLLRAFAVQLRSMSVRRNMQYQIQAPNIFPKTYCQPRLFVLYYTL